MSDSQEQLLSEIRDLLRESNERGKRVEKTTQKRLLAMGRWPMFIFIAFVVFLLLSLLN